MIRFFAVFLLVVSLLFTIELLPPAQNGFVLPFTSAITRASAWLIQLFDENVMAQGKLIWDQRTGFAVSVEAGCNGIEAGIILIAAVLAFPASWSQRALGIAVGLATMQALNLIRIVSLFYIGQWNRTVFEWAHLYIWQALIMLDVLLVFLLWMRWLSARKSAGANDCDLG